MDPQKKGWYISFDDKNKMDQWLDKEVECCNCGEEYKRHMLRWDQTSPISMPGNLCCKECWEGYKELMSHDGTVGDPSFRVPEWPEILDLRNGPPQRCVSGIIYCNGKRIGRVKNYLPKAHYGYVTLDEFPKDAEYGTLEPHWMVNNYKDHLSQEAPSDFWERLGVSASQIIQPVVKSKTSLYQEKEEEKESSSSSSSKKQAPAKCQKKRLKVK